MRRGNTLIELMVALTLLAVAGNVSMRLLYAGNRILRPETARSAATGGQAALLEDLGSDLRGARGVAAGGNTLTVSGANAATYTWDERRQATVRTGGDARAYPGVRAAFSREGRLVRVTLTAGDHPLTTAYWVRNP